MSQKTITPEQLAELFQKFIRAEPGTLAYESLELEIQRLLSVSEPDLSKIYSPIKHGDIMAKQMVENFKNAHPAQPAITDARLREVAVSLFGDTFEPEIKVAIAILRALCDEARR